MIDHDERIALLPQPAEYIRQPLRVLGVQADGGFVQHIKHARRFAAQRPRELHALQLTR